MEGAMISYMTIWIVTILAITLLGEAMGRAGKVASSRAIAWLVLFLGIAFLGGIVGGFIASA